MSSEFQQVFQPHSGPAANPQVEHKNKYAFRNANGNDGFTRFTPPPKVAAVSAAAPSATVVHEPVMPLNVDPEIAKRAEETSKTMIKNASGSLANNFLVVNVAKMALAGMIGGALYGLAKGTAETQGVLYELKYKTSAFDMDPFASQLFHKLGKYEYLQPESYKLAIHYCDKMFLLERHLGSGNERPTDTDVPMAQSCLDGVAAHIMLMRNKSINGEQRGEINTLLREIKDMLTKDHMRRIYSRCATLRL